MQTPQTSPPRHPNPVGGVGLATLGCLRGLPPLGRGMRRTCFIQQTTSSRDRPSAPSTGAKASGHMATQEGNGGRALAREGLCAGGCVAGGAVADPGVTTGSCRGLQTLSSGGGGWKAGSGAWRVLSRKGVHSVQLKGSRRLGAGCGDSTWTRPCALGMTPGCQGPTRRGTSLAHWGSSLGGAPPSPALVSSSLSLICDFVRPGICPAPTLTTQEILRK